MYNKKLTLTHYFSFMVVLNILFLPYSTAAQILFEDNFDDHPDWSPPQDRGIECWDNNSECDPLPPSGYAGYRSASSRFSSGPGHNTLNIDATNYRGSSGKAFTFWNESDASRWASDGVLDIALPDTNGYAEIYVRFYIKFQPDWQWTGSAMQKFFRISHYDGGNPFQFFQNGNHHPVHIADLAKFNKGQANVVYNPAFRYENVYYPSEAEPPFTGRSIFYFGDGNYEGTGTDFWAPGMTGDSDWHSWEFYVKANSAPGVPDGIHRFWQDGVLIAEVTNLAWADEGAQVSPRKLWNFVGIGGNNYNAYAPIEDEAEQWYAIDDLVISTEYIGPDYVIGDPPTHVELISFQGSVNEQLVSLYWRTDSEKNNFGFEIMKSTDNKDYEAVGFIKSQGNATSPRHYSFTDKVSAPGRYFYRLKQIDLDGSFEIIGTVQIEVTIPREIRLNQNYPNPFNPETKISYIVPTQGKVFLVIYNLLGERIRTLVDENAMDPGFKEVIWDGKDEVGNSMPSGIYLYKLETESAALSRKMILFK